MKGPVRYLIVGVLWALSGLAWSMEVPKAEMPERHYAFLENYCLNCHDDLEEKGSINLERLPFDLGTVEAAEMWQKVLNVLNSGEMPPEEKRQPTHESKTDFLEDLSKQIVIARKGQPLMFGVA